MSETSLECASLLNELKDFKKAKNPTKEKYQLFITNKEHPLDERWEVYLEAPESFKERKPYIYHFKVEEEFNIEFYFFDSPFYYDKTQTVYMNSLIERIEDSKKDIFSDLLIQKLKEEILELNLGSFILDW